MLRFLLWDDGDRNAGYVVVDPFCVATVVERVERRGYGGSARVAVIRLMDGKEYRVTDEAGKVAEEIWLAKSYTNAPAGADLVTSSESPATHRGGRR